jgi:hypothetical protein
VCCPRLHDEVAYDGGMRGITVVVGVLAFASTVAAQPPSPEALPPSPSPYASLVKLSLQVVPIDDSTDSPPVTPFGKLGISGEISPLPWLAFEGGFGVSPGLQLAVLAHARVPLGAWAPGIAVGLSHGKYQAAINEFDCSTGIFGGTTDCSYVTRTFESPTWASAAAEVEYRMQRGFSVRLTFGVGSRLSGESMVECTSAKAAECGDHAPSGDFAGVFTASVGYAFSAR